MAALSEQCANASATVGADDAVDWVIPLLKHRDVDHLRAELAQRQARDGLERFVIETVPALNRRIGDGWMTGEIEIFEEHLYTEPVSYTHLDVYKRQASLFRPINCKRG